MTNASNICIFEREFSRFFRGVCLGVHHCHQELKIGTPLTALPGAWRYRVSTGTGSPGVSIH